MGFKPEHLSFALPFRLEILRDEWCVIDLDAHLFHWCYKHISFTILAQDRREQLHQFKTANGRSEVVPGAVARDAHIEVAAIGRVPLMDRGQAFAGCSARRGRQALCGGGHAIL